MEIIRHNSSHNLYPPPLISPHIQSRAETFPLFPIFHHHINSDSPRPRILNLRRPGWTGAKYFNKNQHKQWQPGSEAGIKIKHQLF